MTPVVITLSGNNPSGDNPSVVVNPFVGTWKGLTTLVFNANLTGTFAGSYSFTYTYSGNTAHLSFPFVTYGSNDATIISENALSFAGYIWVKR